MFLIKRSLDYYKEGSYYDRRGYCNIFTIIATNQEGAAVKYVTHGYSIEAVKERFLRKKKMQGSTIHKIIEGCYND